MSNPSGLITFSSSIYKIKENEQFELKKQNRKEILFSWETCNFFELFAFASRTTLNHSKYVHIPYDNM